MDVSIKGVNEEVALFLATLDLIREKHDGPESLARSGDWEFVQESMATLRSTIARVQSKYTRSDTSVRLGDSLPSTYIPAVKAHRIAHLFFAPEAPSFARVEQLDEEEHRFGVSFILVQLNGSMDLVLNLALELPPGGYTLAWRLAPMEVAVGGFKSATTFAASVRQHNETRELPPRVVNFGRVRDCPEIPEEAGTQKGSRGWYEMEVADFEVRAPRAAAARAEGRTSVEVECRISDEVMAAQGYRFPKQRLDLDALVIRPSDNGARRVWWMCDEPFPIKDPEAPVKRRALPWDQVRSEESFLASGSVRSNIIFASRFTLVYLQGFISEILDQACINIGKPVGTSVTPYIFIFFLPELSAVFIFAILLADFTPHTHFLTHEHRARERQKKSAKAAEKARLSSSNCTVLSIPLTAEPLPFLENTWHM